MCLNSGLHPGGVPGILAAEADWVNAKLKVNVVDLFSGPGGLGEGFASYIPPEKKRNPFRLRMSVEFEANAHRTLQHRAFYRKLNEKQQAEFRKYWTAPEAERDSVLAAVKRSNGKLWDEVLEETLHQPTALGNTKEWEKINEGLPVTEEDRTDTEDQLKISERIKVIRKECDDKNEFTVVIGGPPCQAYSGPGRNRIRAVEGYTPNKDPRFFLYREYCRVLHELQPDVFVMENVPGITTATLANDERIFPEIIKALQDPGLAENTELLSTGNNEPAYQLYSLKEGRGLELGCTEFPDFRLISSDYGVPQKRRRVIIVGISNRLTVDAASVPPLKARDQISAETAFGDLPKLRSGLSFRSRTEEGLQNNEDDESAWLSQLATAREELIVNLGKECGTIPLKITALNEDQERLKRLQGKAAFNSAEFLTLLEQSDIFGKEAIRKSVDKFCSAFGNKGTHSAQSAKKWSDTVKRFTSRIRQRREARLKQLEIFPKIIEKLQSQAGPQKLGRGSPVFLPQQKPLRTRLPGELSEFIVREELGGVLNHQAKEHQTFDRKIYLFCSLWTEANGNADNPSPKSVEFPDYLEPDHKNWREGGYADRFRCIASDSVAPTVTSHQNRDGHAFIHPDPDQNRTLSPRECARIQTFPDDYFFEGGRSAQYQQVGNAVPPFLASQIAGWVYDLLSSSRINRR